MAKRRTTPPPKPVDNKPKLPPKIDCDGCLYLEISDSKSIGYCNKIKMPIATSGRHCIYKKTT